MHSQYLTYAEYTALGGALPQASFTLLEFKARKRIDYLTDMRVQKMSAIPEAVKLCTMSLIGMEDAVGVEKQASAPAVTSFSTDGYSETYGKAMGASDADSAMNGVASAMLYGEMDDEGVPLLYRGVTGY